MNWVTMTQEDQPPYGAWNARTMVAVQAQSRACAKLARPEFPQDGIDVGSHQARSTTLNLYWVHSPKLASFKTRGIRY